MPPNEQEVRQCQNEWQHPLATARGTVVIFRFKFVEPLLNLPVIRFAIILTPPKEINLDFALEYIGPDELVEVTPQSIRIRKRILNATERKRENAIRAIKKTA